MSIFLHYNKKYIILAVKRVIKISKKAKKFSIIIKELRIKSVHKVIELEVHLPLKLN